MNNGHLCEPWLKGRENCMCVFGSSPGMLPNKIKQAVQNEILEKHKGRPALKGKHGGSFNSAFFVLKAIVI